MSYALKVEGTTRVKFFDGPLVEFDAQDIEFDVEGSSEKQMGSENLYVGRGYVDGSDDPAIEWEVSEYPIGVINHVNVRNIRPVEFVKSGFVFTLVDTDGAEEMV